MEVSSYFRIIISRGFEVIVMLCIFFNSLCLANYDYSKSKSSVWNQVIGQFEVGFGGFFLLEFFIKVVAMGFIWGTDTYLKNSWNIMDFLIVMTG